MQVEIVRGPTRARALFEARRRLGPDPLVLSIRRQASGNKEGFEWEAVVARETPVAPRNAPKDSASGVLQTLPELETMRAQLVAFERSAQQKAASTSDLLAFARRLSQLEGDLLGSLLGREQVSPTYRPFVERLVASGYPHSEALRLVASISAVSGEQESMACYRRLRQALGERVAVAAAEERIRPGLVVFTGGSGVGKTTLAAKLAADLALGGTRRPVLGVLLPKKALGVDVVRRAAHALDVDFVEVEDGYALAELETVSETQPVILDSSSVNPYDEESLRELAATIQAAPTAEVHAVVPATHGLPDFAIALRAFSFVGARRLAVTRLDEAPFVGRILAAASAGCIPISYISQGPRIPDDLARPGLEALLDAAFRRETRASL